MLNGPVGGVYRCRVCGSTLPIATPLPWRCPHSTEGDRRHLLALPEGQSSANIDLAAANPFLAFRRSLTWDRCAQALGLEVDQRIDMIERLDADVAAVVGFGFGRTPFVRSPAISEALGFSGKGGVWIKDETVAVGGSHKARHLFTTLLHLRLAERLRLAPWASINERPALAISSCGNAAIAAATLAAAVRWPIEVFVPVWASGAVVDTLTALGANIVRCPRLQDDPPGDPCLHAFRRAVGGGAIPFSVQGPENVTCLDGGRTLGWEIISQADKLGVTLDRLFVQVGGGALASCVGSTRPARRFHAVQAAGCAPLVRAWRNAGPAVLDASWNAGAEWDRLMYPWGESPLSLADGILDDEAYDWLGVFEAMRTSSGWPIVAGEHDIVAAYELGRAATTINVSATGTAGLAGLLAIADQVGPDECVGVIFSGVQRG
jgi:threonine synthase